MNLRIMVESRAEWFELFDRLQGAGLLKDISRDDADLSEDLFPMEFFIDIEPLIGMIDNPIVKPFRKMIDGTLTRCVEDAIM